MRGSTPLTTVSRFTDFDDSVDTLRRYAVLGRDTRCPFGRCHACSRSHGGCPSITLTGLVKVYDVTDRLVWIDCEMTGLNLAKDALIEIAVLITDGELNVLDDGLDIVIHAEDAKLDSMVPVVQEMHASSGLTEEVRVSTVSVAEAEKRVLEHVREWVPEPRRLRCVETPLRRTAASWPVTCRRSTSTFTIA